MDQKTFLAKRIAELEQERLEAAEALQNVKQKLKEADAKQAAESRSAYREQWYDIIDGLEQQLITHRSRMTAAEADIREKTRKLEALRASVAGDGPTASAGELPTVAAGPVDSVEAAEAVPESNPVAAPEIAPPESVVTGLEKTHGGQDRLVRALQKALAGDVNGLTFDEADALIGFCASLQHKPPSDEASNRYRKILTPVIDRIRAECGRLRGRCQLQGRD